MELLALLAANPALREIVLAGFKELASVAIHEYEHRRDTDPDFLAQSDAWRAQRAAIKTEADRDASQQSLMALMEKPPAS